MKRALLFDLGGTLVEYYDRSEQNAVLAEALAQVQEFLAERGMSKIVPESALQQMETRREAGDYRVRPLGVRLAQVFGLENEKLSEDFALAMCRRFLQPVFARGRLYEDTLPVLRQLRAQGFKMAIVSNTPWGSPAAPWHEELARLGLSALVDTAVFCTDIGWRKPARQIFEFALEALQVTPQQALFVGDHPVWDIAGAQGVGMEALLIDRRGSLQHEGAIADLYALLALCGKDAA
ncbi:MAG: HAD family hydrolase [Anaerolineae bacterium]|nr:HAD family hydrolase [Anaerolineae bacterium]